MSSDTIEYANVFSDLQAKVAKILREDQWFVDHGVEVLQENLLDIDFQIKNAMARQGCVVVVTTMKGSYIGHDGMVEDWQIDNLEVDVVENPAINRPRLKKLGLEDGVATDVMYHIAERLGGPQGGHFGVFCPKSLEIGENSNLLVGKCVFSCTVRQDVDGVIDPETKVKIPFVTHVEIEGLISEIDSLKAVVEGFDTEGIKADIDDLKAADTALGARIDGLADVYQPKGAYALTSEIPTKVSNLVNDAGYLTAVYWNDVQAKPDVALRTEIPTRLSELANDEGFLKSVAWGQITDKPDVALAADVPVNVSQLENDAGYLTAVTWDGIQGRPDVALKTEIPTKTSQLQNNSGYLTAVAWNDVGQKPRLVTPGDMPGYLSEYPTNNQMTSYVDQKLAEIQPGGDSTRLYNYDKNRYIDGNKVAWKSTPVPGRWTDWQYSDGQSHYLELVDYDGQSWRYSADGRPWMSNQAFDTEEEALNASELVITDIETGDDLFTASRQWIDPYSEWTQEGVLALTNQIPRNISQLENDANYLTEVSWQDVKDKPDVALKTEIPTKTSELENDSGYLTEHQSLEGYATKDYVDAGIQDEVEARFEEDARLRETIGRKADASDIPTKTSELENDSGFVANVYWDDIPDRPDMQNYATMAYVDERLDAAQ